MVRGLVEEQHVGARHEHLREQHAELKPARQGRQRGAVRRRRDAQPREDRARARLQGVSVEGRERLLDLRGAGRVGVIAGGEGLALLQQRERGLIAAHRHVEDARVAVEEAVLPEHAHARGLRD